MIACEEVNALIVKSPSEGGQSRIITSYFLMTFFSAVFSCYSLAIIFTNSTSAPTKSFVEAIISR